MLPCHYIIISLIDLVYKHDTPYGVYGQSGKKWQQFILNINVCDGPQLSHQSKWHIMGSTGAQSDHFNSLAPGKFEWNFRDVLSKWILVIAGWGISCEIALIWMSLYFTDDQSTLVQIMAWCHQATSHYLSQCWPRSLGHNELKAHQIEARERLGHTYVIH